MKTDNVPSNRPVQNNQNQPAADAKKPQKDFKEVLDHPEPKVALKKKGFSPLGGGEKKMMKGGADKMTGASNEHRRISGKGEQCAEEKDSAISKKKGEVTPDASQVVQAQASMAGGPTAVHEKGGVDGIQRPGLNINEIQSIVNKVHAGINEKGLPEMRFELQTKHLGNIHLSVSSENDKIKLHFATEDVNAKEVLEKNLKDLSEQLRDKGLTLAETKFSSQDEQKQEQQQKQQEQAWDGPSYAPSAPPKKTFNL